MPRLQHRTSKRVQRKFKNIDELTKGFESFIKGKKRNPNHQRDFEHIAAGKKVKQVS